MTAREREKDHFREISDLKNRWSSERGGGREREEAERMRLREGGGREKEEEAEREGGGVSERRGEEAKRERGIRVSELRKII